MLPESCDVVVVGAGNAAICRLEAIFLAPLPTNGDVQGKRSSCGDRARDMNRHGASAPQQGTALGHAVDHRSGHEQSQQLCCRRGSRGSVKPRPEF